MTKDLGKKKHREFRDVLFGRKPITIVSLKLPESHKMYLRRHNEELARRVKEVKLSQAFQKSEDNTVSNLERDENRKLVKALLTILAG